jgi:predicted nucleotidyltransferase
MRRKLRQLSPGECSVTQGELLKTVVAVLESQSITYMIVGSFASTVYGEPRFTLDIDIVVDLQSGQLEALCDAFPAGEFYLSRPAADEAVRKRRQFNVIHPGSGNKIDFMVARSDTWGRTQLERRRRRPFLPDCEAWTASPEDIILAKMIYYREGKSEKHTRDITGMLRISGNEIDRSYIADWSEQLGLADIWGRILTRLESAAGGGRERRV